MLQIFHGFAMVGIIFTILFLLLGFGPEEWEGKLVYNAKWLLLFIIVVSIIFGYFSPELYK